MHAGSGRQVQDQKLMGADLKHEVSFSGLPRRLNNDSGKDAKSDLSWDKPSLRKRILFVMDLLCGRPSMAHIQFVDPIEMGSLNWQFRGKDTPTDVLSFIPHESAAFIQGGSGRSRSSSFNLGDVVVCAEVCAEQARRHRCSLSQEIERMIVHSLVHLIGLDHERSRPSHSVMTALESSIRRQLTLEFGPADFCDVQPRVIEKKKRGVRR
jgi:probable rRNA maturation factor